MVPGSAASGAPGNMLEIETLGPHCKPTESETLGVEPCTLGLEGLPGNSEAN